MCVRGARIHVIFEEMSTVYGVVPPFLIGYPGVGGGWWYSIGGGLDTLAGGRRPETPLARPECLASSRQLTNVS